MKLILKILLLCILDSFGLSAQIDNNNNQRKAFKLTLAVDDQYFYESEIEASSYLNGPNILQIYPGEVIYIEVIQKDGVISNLKCVKTNIHPENTLEISFTQKSANNKHEMMLLKVVNPFTMDLSYSANMFLMSYNKWAKTNILPVKAKLTSYETWPDVIVTLALSDWKFSNWQLVIAMVKIC